MSDDVPPLPSEVDLAIALGQRIAEARTQAGLTLRVLAGRMGIDHSTLANYEAGRRPLRVVQLIAIARAIGVAPAALLIDPPEARAIVNRIDGDLERALQVSYILETLDLPEP
jgi:transcriptional regulator with XRE-family HTH domain